MKKWLSWLLSDHTAFLSANARTGQLIPALLEMTAEEIEARLPHAWTNSCPVAVQLKVRDDQHQTLIEGAVRGFDGGQVTLISKEIGTLTMLIETNAAMLKQVQNKFKVLRLAMPTKKAVPAGAPFMVKV